MTTDIVKTSTAEIAAARQTEAQSLRDRIKAMPITMANLSLAEEIRKQAKKKRTQLEAELKKITAPLLEAEKAARDLFRPAISALTEAEGDLKTRMLNVRNAAVAANATAMKAAGERLAEGDTRGAALAGAAIQDTALPQGVHERKRWNFRVVDEAQVPRELCSPDDKKIRAYVAAYENRNAIPGVEIYEDPILVGRG
jgi:hypothetical protein